eukprot:g703.t1
MFPMAKTFSSVEGITTIDVDDDVRLEAIVREAESLELRAEEFDRRVRDFSIKGSFFDNDNLDAESNEDDADAVEKRIVLLRKLTRFYPENIGLFITLGHMEARLARTPFDFSTAMLAFSRACMIDPVEATDVYGLDPIGIAVRLRKLAVALKDSDHVERASACLKRANVLNPPPPPLPSWFVPMMNDRRRNRAYEIAVAHATRQGKNRTLRVLDIGAGSGFLSILASKSPRVARVVGIEIEPSLSRIARENVEKNRKTSTLPLSPVRILTGHSNMFHATHSAFGGEKCDVLVSEVLDDALIGPSDWLGTLQHARDHLLRTREDRLSAVVPASAVVRALFVQSAELRRLWAMPTIVESVDIGAIQKLVHRDGSSSAHQTLQLAGLREYRILSDEIVIQRWDFESIDETSEDFPSVTSEWRRIEVPGGFVDDGIVDAIVFLWDAQLVRGGSASTVVSNRPHMRSDRAWEDGDEKEGRENASFMRWNSGDEGEVQARQRCSDRETCDASGVWLASNHWLQEAQLFKGGGLSVTSVCGDNILTVAHKNDINLEGACECSIACSTCHVILEDEMFDELPEPCEAEEDMLDLAFGLTPTSRLGCQVIVDTSHDGTKIELPSATRNFYVDGHVPQPH